MDIETAVAERRSIRKFGKEAVPEALISEILDEARWSPSWGNTQSWEFYVVTGGPLEAVKKANRQKIREGAIPSPDITMPLEWPDRMKARYMGVGKSVLTALKIARDDQESRFGYNTDMFYLFDAPCLIIAVQDRAVTSRYALLDVGIILQTICLLAHGKGLGTCIMACAVAYADVLRSIVKIPESKTIVMGAVLGWPDPEAPINRFERQRASLDDVVTWVR